MMLRLQRSEKGAELSAADELHLKSSLVTHGLVLVKHCRVRSLLAATDAAVIMATLSDGVVC